MTKVALLLFIGAAASILSGCTTDQRIGDFTAISTKNVYAKGVDVTKLPQKPGVEGQDLHFFASQSTVKTAIDRALEAGDGNLMIDAVMYYHSQPFAAGYKVRGTVVKIPYQRVESKDSQSPPVKQPSKSETLNY